ncbi:aryldialkylphosphatase [Mesorhizobium sp. L-8-3]|nr:aryldialkylphosphatase [Mesorhizobium sp. L-8-3]
MRLSRNEMRGKAQTVLGLVDPAMLGQALMHEHLFWDFIQPGRQDAPTTGGPDPRDYWKLLMGGAADPRDIRQQDRGVAAREAALMVEAGGGTIVELTIGGIGPDPEGLMEVSRGSGAHIVMGCGHYVEDCQDAGNHNRTVESFAQEMIDQVQLGAWGTDARAGIIGEIGCQWPWTDLEKRVLAAAVIAQQETGAALTIHPARHEDHPWMLIEFLKEHGADLSRTIIDHIDRTIFDDDRLFRLADSGVVLEWDLFGLENTYYSLADIDMPNDGMRIRTIRRLIDRGHLGQIVISHDICNAIRLAEFGGHGYTHIQQKVLPHMRKRGYSGDEINAIMIDNPHRLLTFV